MPKYSVITPVYNRPDEVAELLESLTKQTFKDFEVIIVEDGSTLKCEDICRNYSNKLSIQYFYKPNSGQGDSRNFGFQKATSDYFIQVDSDAILPENYIEIVDKHLTTNWLDAYGGPDTAHENFTDVQKAINYSMTSLFTTGGIRGKKNNAGGQFYPRSCNFGISRKVYEKTGGYRWNFVSEDMEYGIRILKNGFSMGLIEDAFIYHKRRTDFSKFYQQTNNFGRGRVKLYRYFGLLKLVHLFPTAFFLFCVSLPILFFLSKPLFYVAAAFLMLYLFLIFIDSTLKNKSLKVGFLSILACFIQLFGYGIGLLQEFISPKLDYSDWKRSEN